MRGRAINPRLAIALALAAGFPAPAAVIYVRAGAAGAGTGTSWADAFPVLQPALAAARPGDQGWVARGTYRPAGPGGARDVSFALRQGVATYGGFAGTEAALEQRDIPANPTILSGDLNADDGPQFVNSIENSYHVVVAAQVDQTAILDGFVIRGGRADGPGAAGQDQGSAVDIASATPLIQQCTIEANWSAARGAVNDRGGATIVGCALRGNWAGQEGGGLYIAVAAPTTVRGCIFEANATPHDGGAAFSAALTGATIEDSSFTANTAERGAGIFIAADGTLGVTNCVFTGNDAELGGGGVFCNFARPEVLGCVFTNNQAGVGIIGGGGGGGGSGGGGLWFSGGWASVFDCGFYGNRASFGGGVYHNEGGQGVVYGCIFDGNIASEAGGLYALSSPVLVDGCLFKNNTAAGGSFPVGGGMSTYFSGTTTRGCTFIHNSAELGGGGMYCEGESPVITLCRFIGNSSFGTPALQEGWGGGVMNGYNTLSTLRDCAFFGNRAKKGAGVFNMFLSQPLIAGCTITGNTSDEEGGGLYTYFNSTVAVVNAIVSANAPEEVAGSPVTASYSCIVGGYPGMGVIAVDPMLTRPPWAGPDGLWGTSDDDYGDLTPRPGSRCIDAGDSGAVPSTATEDLAHNPRRRDDAGTPDTGIGGSPVVDLGAYEFQGQTCYANCDQSTAAPALNVADFVCFMQRFAASDPLANCDNSTAPPTLNVADFVCFMQRFAAGCP